MTTVAPVVGSFIIAIGLGRALQPGSVRVNYIACCLMMVLQWKTMQQVATRSSCELPISLLRATAVCTCCASEHSSFVSTKQPSSTAARLTIVLHRCGVQRRIIEQRTKHSSSCSETFSAQRLLHRWPRSNATQEGQHVGRARDVELDV